MYRKIFPGKKMFFCNLWSFKITHKQVYFNMFKDIVTNLAEIIMFGLCVL